MNEKVNFDDFIGKLIIILILLVLSAIFVPAIILTINNEQLGITIVTYLGSIIGAVLSVFGALLAVFYSFRNQQLNQMKIDASKKLYSLSAIDAKSREFLAESVKEDVILSRADSYVSTDEFFEYLNRYKQLYELLIEKSLEVDFHFYRNIEKLYEEINDVAAFVEIFIITDVEFAGFGKGIFKDYDMFSKENIEIVINKSDQINKRINRKLHHERDSYNLFEVDLIFRRTINKKINELKKVVEREKSNIISKTSPSNKNEKD